MCYSIESREKNCKILCICLLIWICRYICLFIKISAKILVKNNNLSGKYSQKPLDHTKNLLQMLLKLLQKEQFEKQQKQLVI